MRAHASGRPLDGDKFEYRVFYRVLNKSNLRRVRFHDLRHTYASMLIQNGENLMYVKEQLGHSSIQFTVDIYGHLIPGANRQAVNRLHDVILAASGSEAAVAASGKSGEKQSA